MVSFSARSILAASLLWTTTLGQTGSLVAVSNWGTNPTNIQMYNYIPRNLAAKPAVILALHYCGGSGPAYVNSANYNTAAEQYGFITIYPSTTHDNNCWDVASAKSLTHEGGGDTQGLANMVKYVINKYNADPTRIYVTGSSSGGMMTNVLCAVYPDVFAAGSAYSGVAAGCLAGSPGASPSTADPTCANGNIRKSSAAWVSQVKAMYPSYSGAYPRFQTWHGTADNLVFYPNLEQQILEWSGLLGVSFTKNNTNTPQSGYTQIVYGDGTKFVAYSAQGVGHTVPVHVPQDLAWFGIPGSGTGTGGGTGGGTTTAPGGGTTTTAPGGGGGTTPPSSGGTVAQWGQCGGMGWTGGTTCVSPYTCKASNQYYSQCL